MHYRIFKGQINSVTDTHWDMRPDLPKALMLAKRQLAEYDVNKRLGRFMMNGLLLAHGYPAINLPAKRQLEFNTLMLAFYASGDESAMNAFLRSCLDPRVIAIMKE